jgi:2,3,4,5-tetrahydropyridine-2-carboxylate N-succinyltransferase
MNEELKQKYDFTDPYQIAQYIKDVKKSTPVKLYVSGNLTEEDLTGYEYYGPASSCIIFTEAEYAQRFIEAYKDRLSSYRLEYDRRNSAIPLLDTTRLQSRIEPGSFIRDGAIIGKGCVVMMGAVVNIGANIGDETMLDMGCIVGARVHVGKRCHVGAGAVLAGVLEPPSKMPVMIGDDVLIGANAVVLEGVQVGDGSVIAAGAIVTQDVAGGVVVAGSPAKVIKAKDEKTISKTEMLDDLRKGF